MGRHSVHYVEVVYFIHQKKIEILYYENFITNKSWHDNDKLFHIGINHTLKLLLIMCFLFVKYN